MRSRSGALQKYSTGILLLGRRQAILESLSVFGGIMQVGDLVKTHTGNFAFVAAVPPHNKEWINIVFLRTGFLRTGFPACWVTKVNGRDHENR